MRIRDRVVDIVSRLPARVQTKLLAAFLVMAALLMLMGAVGLQALQGVNRQTEELIRLQRKIAAFRQVQHDTTAQLYGVTSALLAPDEQVLHATLRQLTQFGYDLDRLQYVASDEVELLARVRGVGHRSLRRTHGKGGFTRTQPHARQHRGCRDGHSIPRHRFCQADDGRDDVYRRRLPHSRLELRYGRVLGTTARAMLIHGLEADRCCYFE